jgi:hypothetical protein
MFSMQCAIELYKKSERCVLVILFTLLMLFISQDLFHSL